MNKQKTLCHVNCSSISSLLHTLHADAKIPLLTATEFVAENISKDNMMCSGLCLHLKLFKMGNGKLKCIQLH